MLLNNDGLTKILRIKIKIYLETYESEKTTTQYLWDTAKSVLRGKSIPLQAYLKIQEKSPINAIILQLEELEKDIQMRLRVSRRKEIIKTRAEIKEIASV